MDVHAGQDQRLRVMLTQVCQRIHTTTRRRTSGVNRSRTPCKLVFVFIILILVLACLQSIQNTTSLYDKTFVTNWLPQPDSPNTGIHYSRSQVPLYLREEFVLTAYRAHLTLSDCFWSIFQLHNETVYIWSHLLPAMMFWYLAIYFLHKKQHPFILVTLCTSKALVFSASSLAHTFNPVNESWYIKCWQLDWGAISFAVFGTCTTVVTFGFYYHSKKLRFWNTTFAVACLVMLVVSTTPSLILGSRVMRALLPLIPVLCGVGLVLDLKRTLPKSDFEVMYKDLVGPLLFALFGMIVYGSDFPERFLPGHFDVTGGSHTFHHLWSTIFAGCMLRNALKWSEWRHGSNSSGSDKQFKLPV